MAHSLDLIEQVGRSREGRKEFLYHRMLVGTFAWLWFSKGRRLNLKGSFPVCLCHKNCICWVDELLRFATVRENVT